MQWMALAKHLTDTMTEDYVREVPYQIKKIAVKDAYAAWRTECRKAKKDGKQFTLHFRSRKNNVQTIYIPKSAVKEPGIYHTMLGRMEYAETDWFGTDFADCRLTREDGRYYLTVPCTYERQGYSSCDVKADNQGFDVVALDPGIRTFITYFSVNGKFGKIGHRAYERIVAKCVKMDKMTSAKDKETDRKHRRRLHRSIARLRWRISDMVDQLHWETIAFLTRNFSVIYLPTFETSQMVSRKSRKIRSKTARSMMGFRFYEFSQRLAAKCAEHGVTLVRCNEAYTSKTNSFTGEIMPKLGGKERFKYDGVTVDRDINGARNILLRAMRDASVTA